MSDSEFALISRFFSQQSVQRSDVDIGVGDDAAVLQVRAGQRLAISTDVLVAGQHFFADADPVGVGHKALAVNLSDLAAMGATPAWVTLGLTLPAVNESWLAGFCQGFFSLAEHHGVQLIGGDTTRGPLSIAVQIHGWLDGAMVLTRSGAQPGDRICVTGTLGDACLGLALLRGEQVVKADYQAYLRQRLEQPQPRIQAGQQLLGLATAAIDISDGLAQDLGHILRLSRVGARLDLLQLPASAELQATLAEHERWRAMLTGGDDYELCFTVPAARLATVQALSSGWDCGCTVIGTIDTQPGLRCVLPDGALWTPSHLGYDHFVG